MWTRNPALLAPRSRRSTTSPRAGSILGIGAWWDPLAAKVGISRDKPLRAMREIVTAVRALLADETVTFDGEFVHLDGVELDYVHQERRPKDVPIYIGATGMQMMELTGEIADGVAPQLPRLAGLQRRAHGRSWRRGPTQAGPDGRRHRPAAARRVLDATTTAPPRSTRPACSSPSTSASSRTS